jgi:hypothetical protein
MPLFEDRSASFIVRVWCESGDGEARAVRAWRGSIEHVPSGQRVYFQELDAVIAFMKPHLVALGIEEPNRFWERMEDTAAPAAAPAPPQIELDPLPVTRVRSSSGTRTPRRGR